jgi:hypothetical protein
LTFAALIIGHHLAASVFCSARSASGVCLSGAGRSTPTSPRRFFTAGSASVSTTAALSFAITSLGVPFGTQSPDHTATLNPGSPASPAVGISGAAGKRLVSVTP